MTTRDLVRAPARSRPRLDRAAAYAALEALCAGLRPGDRVPTHAELMRTLHVSERVVLAALDELQRAGKVVRRNGVGTFVAEAAGDAVAPSLLPAAGGGTIVALARPDQSFFDLCLQELHRQAAHAGLTLVCRPVDSELSELLALPRASERPRGFVVFHRSLEPLAWRLHEAGCRVAMIGAPVIDAAPRVPCVHGDHELGGYLTARHLLELGHRRLAFQGGADAERTPRWLGVQRALAEAGRRHQGLRLTLVTDQELAAWRHEPLLAAGAVRGATAPTAIIAWNDHHAMQLVGILGRAGVQVPRDVSVAGYDNLPESAMVYPPLTTVDHALPQQVTAALGLLMRSQPPPPTYTLVTVPTLVTRGSTAPPPAALLPRRGP
jgi:LacI family transcriptional regulator